MTDTLRPGSTEADNGRDGDQDPADRPRLAAIFFPALAAVGWAVAVSLVPLTTLMLVIWLVDGVPGSTAPDAFGIAVGIWFVGHGVTVGLGGAAVGLAPLVLSALLVWQLARAGRVTAEAVSATRPGDIAWVVAVVTALYGAVATLALVLVRVAEAPVSMSMLSGLVQVVFVAAVASVAGTLRIAAVRSALIAWAPVEVRASARGGAIAALGLLGTGALVAAAGLAVNGARTAELMGGLDAGAGGVIGLLVVSLLYAPTLVVWTAAYLAGPGFGFGTGTVVSVFAVKLGPIPAIPLLAGLPTAAAPSLAVVLLVPVAAGLIGGYVTVRQSVPAQSGSPQPVTWRASIVHAAMVGLCAGVLAAAGAHVTGGSLGVGRLAQVGAVWWQIGPAVAVAVFVGAVLAFPARLAVAWLRAKRTTDTPPAEPSRPTSNRIPGLDKPETVAGESGENTARPVTGDPFDTNSSVSLVKPPKKTESDDEDSPVIDTEVAVEAAGPGEESVSDEDENSADSETAVRRGRFSAALDGWREKRERRRQERADRRRPLGNPVVVDSPPEVDAGQPSVSARVSMADIPKADEPDE